jgi:hypothetical protein
LKVEDIKNQLISNFDFLLTKHSFLIQRFEYNEQAFGNIEMLLASENINIRILRDKGQFTLSISSSQQSKEWFDLFDDLLAMMNSEEYEQYNKGLSVITPRFELPVISNILNRYYFRIVDLLNKYNFITTLKNRNDLAAKRVKKWFNL